MIEALAVAAVVAACSWDRPGHRAFTGDVPAAVQRYTDIPAPVRAKLQARMSARQYDDVAEIRRDSIAGKHAYAPDIRDMHFGAGQVCGTVTRARWSDKMVERGLVYCEAGHCILVPTVCRNVSRITRLTPAVTATPAPVEPVAAPAEVRAESQPPALALLPEVPFDIQATGAGPIAQAAPAEGSFAAGGAYASPPAFGSPALFIPGPVVVLPPAPLPAIPEPGTWLLMLVGVLALIFRRAAMSRNITDFVRIYRMYRRCHSRRYAFHIAYGCAFRGLPF